jgi:hypothetical protein
MQKSTWLMTMVGLFLAAALIWAVPAFAQPQGGPGGGMCPRGYNQGAGPGYGGGPGYCANYNNSQTCPGYGYGNGRQGRNRNRARWNNNNAQTPVNPQPQPQTQTPAPQSGN